jgi:hypothetical protein
VVAVTDPLIDRNELRNRLQDWTPLAPEGAADVAMAYLRSVLTPEALEQPREPDGTYKGDVIVTGTGMYRRIFGDQ